MKLPRRHAQKLSAPLRPEDCFGFEIVDVDEASNLKVNFIFFYLTDLMGLNLFRSGSFMTQRFTQVTFMNTH